MKRTVRCDPGAVVALGTALLGGLACCVCADAPVDTPDGVRRLGDLQPGDAIWSVDVATGLRTSARVVARRVARRECVRLVHRAGSLVCTPDHPLYAPETASYEPAARWVDGQRRDLLLAIGEVVEVAPVLEVLRFAGLREVVDLTVSAAPHNFVAGAVVVHNKTLAIEEPEGHVEGPKFSLTPDEPLRRFEIRACVVGEDPGEDSDLFVEVASAVGGSPLAGEMRYAVRFEAEEARMFDGRAGQPASLWLESLAGACTTPRAIVFERLDDRPHGTIDLTWTLDGRAAPPPGTSFEDEMDIDIEE